MYDIQFAERLTQLRTTKGVSARDMSLSLGQNPGYINNIESGKALPSMSVFFYICDYFMQPSSSPPYCANTGAKTSATIVISLIKIFIAGPEVSLNGSPTVSPVTAAL